MVKTIFFICCICIGAPLAGQPSVYSVANLHAHNDYEHNTPFSDAYALQLGSIEADVLLIRDSLFVAHSVKQISQQVLLQNAYLDKLAAAVKANHGFAYADPSRVLQLLIDIKTDSLQTLDAVIRQITQYPLLLNNPSIRFVITGNQPDPKDFDTYPGWLFFDGKINNPVHRQERKRIALFSANFAEYSKWKGEGNIPDKDLAGIRSAIGEAHALHKPFRFWGVPDGPHVWKIMTELGVDFINTDHISAAAAFVNGR
ncbi:MAG: alkaline phosphatase [Bacteroidota bacterium]|nr:alkaline phosphatase [Bacteroidota bacterium]